MSAALRRALHACADLIADALEEDAIAATGPVFARPKKRRGPAPPAPIRQVDASPEARAQALSQARRNGVL